ncbi:C-X-C motif chemokine 16 isoform X2 [Mirounga angustirostris]|uniref:C-X-C motif chemokine 16 isoform X2 n=1 Tax=Mirounga angustirostris TaxID=9716 RepID=UPI00313B29DF
MGKGLVRRDCFGSVCRVWEEGPGAGASARRGPVRRGAPADPALPAAPPLRYLQPPPLFEGDGNEGSAIGSCYCHKAIPSGRPPMAEFMAHLRKHLRAYDRCNSYVRFQLQARSVCGGSKDSWVQQLMSCFDRKECGYANSGSAAPQEHLPPPSTQVPEPTQRAPSDTGSPAQTYPPPASQSTVQPTLPAGARSLDKNLTRANEIATSTEGRSLAAGPEAGERHKQLEEKVGPSAGTSAMVPVLSLLAIIFILTIVLLYVLCKRMAHSLPQSPDLQLPYIPVASDSKA